MERRPSPDQIRESPPRRQAELDPAQVAVATAALVEFLTMRRVESSGSDSSDGDDVSGRPDDRHHWYPPIQSLEAGDARLFFVSGTAGSVPGLPDAPQGDGVHRFVCAHHQSFLRSARFHSAVLVPFLLDSVRAAHSFCMFDLIPYVLLLLINQLVIMSSNGSAFGYSRPHIGSFLCLSFSTNRGPFSLSGCVSFVCVLVVVRVVLCVWCFSVSNTSRYMFLTDHNSQPSDWYTRTTVYSATEMLVSY
jgi:hypothetical protein